MPDLTKFRILPLSLLAVLCFATAVGPFDDESGIAETQKSGHLEFNSLSGEYAISGTGDIGGTSDGFHYVWKKVTGDVTISADTRFAGGGIASGGKAALMIRQSLDPRAAYAAAVLRGDGFTALQYRVDTGAASKTSEVIERADLSSTVYMTLERRGDAFAMSAGKRGKMGGPLPFSAPVTVTMNGPVYVGLAVASPDPAVRDAVFSNVYLQPIKTP